MSHSATYNGLLVEVQLLITGDQAGASRIAYGTLQTIMELGQRKLYRDVRSRHNEVAFSAVAVSSNLAAIPADWEATSVIHFGEHALIPKPEDWVRSYVQSNTSGDCKYFAEAGGSFYFAPPVADGTFIQGRYFARLDDLTEDNIAANALYQAESDLFVYAALSESAEFFPVGARIQVWETKYQRIVDKLNTAKDRAAYSAGRVQRTPSARLIG